MKKYLISIEALLIQKQKNKSIVLWYGVLKTAFRIENGVKFVKILGYLLIKSVENSSAGAFT